MFIFDISRRKKQALMIGADIFLVALSLWLAFALRLSQWFWPSEMQLWLFILGPILALPIFIKLGLYRAVIRYIGAKAMFAVIQAVTALVLIWLVIAITVIPLYAGVEKLWLPRSIPILFWMSLLLTVGGSRQVIRLLLLSRKPDKTGRPTRNILIYGASRSGIELATSLSHNKDVRLLGFIDDDSSLHDHYVQNLKVLGDRTEIEKIRTKTNHLEVLLAIPNANKEVRKELLKYLETKRVTVRTIPSLGDITSRSVTRDDLRDLEISDLLSRKTVLPNKNLLSACITNKKILVTGAGGSIGSELCRQILALDPTLIILFEHSEINLYKINTELVNQSIRIGCNVKIIPLLGTITNKQRVENTIKKFEIDTIYHAAAYKHVSLIEHNIEEGILNNIFGTYNVAQSAIDLKVESFILISTDKAVNPTSVMGATKRIAELIIQGLSQKNKSENTDEKKYTRMVIVRFGNVLGSSGSVIPLFQKQIAAGGPITITHPEATRYFMTIQEASQLVLQAGSINIVENCSIFALNMGDPISILSLAKQLVYLSGHMLKTDESSEEEASIEIQYTGLKQGEKIHEELFIGNNITSTQHPMILEAQESCFEWSNVKTMLDQLNPQHNLNSENIRKLLLKYAGSRTNSDI